MAHLRFKKGMGGGGSVEAIQPRALLRKKLETKELQKLTNMDVSALDKLFNDLKGDSEEQISLDKFSSLMQNTGLEMWKDKTLCENFYSALDVNGDGSVDKKELICGLSALSSGDLDKKLSVAFNVFDMNHDGSIQRSELQRMMMTVASMTHEEGDLEKFVDEFVKRTFDEFDENHDDQLSLEEFSTAAKKRVDVCEYFTLRKGMK
eukprot:CAMPEP_0177653046 /NCGR_PEP_ID=MMETSP0447-20121125/13499_1 /TAXON_ID=0 /ORGANISM="Stygamoeba regulata, Strain BSH-02190019" /LENGTH=205 /DNA_ID=CAMNT_0019156421 /DNA_START=235 /DNA_END=852 /DNA_ORIENTATION=+